MQTKAIKYEKRYLSGIGCGTLNSCLVLRPSDTFVDFVEDASNTKRKIVAPNQSVYIIENVEITEDD